MVQSGEQRSWRPAASRVLLLGVAAALLSGCSSASPAPSGSTAAGTAAPAAAGASSGPAGTGASPAASASSAVAAAPAAPAAGGGCSMIDMAGASALLGTTPKQINTAHLGASTEDGVTVTKLDGCTYTADPSLGYDVNRFDGMGPVTGFIAAAKAQMGAQPGVTPMAVALGDDAVGFTVVVGGKTMARIEVAKGQTTIAVVSTATDAAKAKSVALAAATQLLGKLG